MWTKLGCVALMAALFVCTGCEEEVTKSDGDYKPPTITEEENGGYPIYLKVTGTKITGNRDDAGYPVPENLVIPDGITEIGEYAFEGCEKIKTVTIPSSVTKIDVHAFAGCTALTGVTIPDSVQTIGDQAFGWCDSLATVTIGKGVKTIGEGAFKNSGLTSVTIPGSVTTIGKGVFEECDKLASATLDGCAVAVSENMFRSCTALATVTLSGVTSIEKNAFDTCTKLSKVSIPDSVTEIGSSAFNGCSALATVTIGKGVTKIAGHAFFDSGLTSVTFSDTEGWYSSSTFDSNKSINVGTPASNAANLKDITSTSNNNWGSTGIYKKTN